MLPVEDAPGYRVLDQAGQGGFAVVYRAYQERLDRVVALKVLSVDRVDQRTMRRFQRELQLTGRLTGHPNVVTVFDTGVTRSGKPYIAMDFFEHGSLRDKIRKEGPLPLPDVLRAGVKLAGALAAVHDAGVLHGDIKPQNILISRYGEPAIADFGVARVVDSAEISATSQAFTPLHAAPEVLTGRPHSASTDIYSLGSTLYHLLAGQPAFHNPSDPSIAPLMYRVLSLEPPPINRPDVPGAVFAAILRAMSKEPGARYGSARELARHLQALQAELGLPVTDLVGLDAAPPQRLDAGPPPPANTGFPSTGHHLPPTPVQQSPPAPAHLPPAPAHHGPPAPAHHGPPAPAHQGSHAAATHPTGTTTSRTGRMILIGGTTAAVVVAGTALAVHLSMQPPATTTRPTTTTTTDPQQQGTTDTQEPIGEKQVAALAPRQVKVTDQGALVELRWSLPAGARDYPVVVQRSPVKQGEQAITPLQQGATSTRVAGLDPDTGYCFLVGVPLRISESSTVAWSKPACIRGAVARSTQ
ncbi:serine/threonine-protein kinase [Nonomuraea gerenzanensis]|uniref:non-specific serine/threonine protein kinase n=1 Tax=Nonomuraea gerenzanensis TaxID=93944 RepID=A0A1M4EJK3_9ACTN|nr:serine/threonine-protein kinase [Nonomuraea gerenzanensis]UBU10487.1 serine/threonine protein kinase [Nonomuraea gerenzanensis]SBO98888.1 protein kinase [Nonomuraea gerenzanensis]